MLLTGIDPRDYAKVRDWQTAHGVPATGLVRLKTMTAAWAWAPGSDTRLLQPRFDSWPQSLKHRAVRHAYAGEDDMKLLEPTFRAVTHVARAPRRIGSIDDDFSLLEPDFSAHPQRRAGVARYYSLVGDDDLRLLEPDFANTGPPWGRARRPPPPPAVPSVSDADEDAKLLRRR